MGFSISALSFRNGRSKSSLVASAMPFTGNGKTKFRLYKDWEQTGAGYHNDFGRIATGIDMIMKLEPECGNNPGKAAKLIIKLFWWFSCCYVDSRVQLPAVYRRSMNTS